MKITKMLQNEDVKKFLFYAALIVFAIIAWHVIGHIEHSITRPSSSCFY